MRRRLGPKGHLESLVTCNNDAAAGETNAFQIPVQKWEGPCALIGLQARSHLCRQQGSHESVM